MLAYVDPHWIGLPFQAVASWLIATMGPADVLNVLRERHEKRKELRRMPELSRTQAHMTVMFFIISLTAGASLAASPTRGDFRRLFASNKVDEAKKVFADAHRQLIEHKQYKAAISLVDHWLKAVCSAQTPPSTRRAGMEYIAELYSWEKFGWTDSLWAYGQVAEVSWVLRSPAQALEYSKKLLVHCKARGRSAEWPLIYVLCRLRSVPDRGKELAEARKSFAEACAQAFPVSGIGAKEALSVTFYKSLIIELFMSGPTDTGWDYLQQLLKHSKSWDKLPLLHRQSAPSFVRHIIGITLGRSNAKLAIRVQRSFIENTPDERLWESWSRLMADVPQGEQKARYLDLLKRDGAAAVRASLGLWVEDTEGTEIEKVIREHCAPMFLEIELGVESRSFQHLLDLLKTRNASAEIRELAEFLWQTFPDSHIGRQAFGAWSEQQEGIIGEAAVVETARELVNCYPTSQIARRARLELSKAQMARGHILEGLLLANHDPEDEPVTDQTVLTISLLRRLVAGYVQDCKNNRIEVNQAETLRKLATEFDKAGEKRIACVLYWGAVQEGSVQITDPRTSMPINIPVGGTRARAATDGCRAAFWRIMALIAAGHNNEAEKTLEQAVAHFPESQLIATARLYVANHYYDRYRGIESPDEFPMRNLEKAWRHWDACPEKLKDCAKQWPLYQAMVNHHTQKLEQERLNQLKSKLASAHRDRDGTLMAIADILLRKKDFANAVKHYEEVVTHHPESPDRPRALYNAILIYRTKVLKTERVAELTKMLETQYPNSHYTLI